MTTPKTSAADHARSVTHKPAIRSGHNIRVDHPPIDTHTSIIDSDNSSATDRLHRDTQAEATGGGSGPVRVGTVNEPKPAVLPLNRPSLDDPALAMIAALLDDIEGVRKANANRYRILTTPEDKFDEDGGQRAIGLDEASFNVSTLAALGQSIENIEAQTVKALEKAMRMHPLAPWQKQAKGVGEKQLARLLAAIGDPYLRIVYDEDDPECGVEEPRTVSQLWAYCGLHTLPGETDEPTARVAAKRKKGVKSNWSTNAKTRAYLIATSCIKTKGVYRDVYDKRRAHTAITNPEWTPGHSHNDALRILSKAMLKDLWKAARDYHEGDEQ